MTKDNLEVIKLFDKELYILGTAHVSKTSVEETQELIRSIKPDSVVIELCKSRYDALKNPDLWKKMDIVSVIKNGKAYLLLSQMVLSAFQKRIGKSLQVRPGEEMIVAAKTAEEVNSQIVLGDREVSITLKRVWASLSFMTSIKLLSALLDSFLVKTEVSEAEIENLKSTDMLNEMLNNFSKAFPEVTNSLIYERDSYLAYKIKNAPGEKIVAIVGAGHLQGIKKNLNSNINISELEKIPNPTLLSQIIKWSIPVLFVFFLVKGFLADGMMSSLNIIGTWSLITGGLAAFGALVGGAHPITIIASGLSAPITTIHPLLGSGMVAALVEASIRKPKVEDFETVSEEIYNFKSWYKNRVLRVFLILMTTSLFGSIGTFLGFFGIAK